MKVLYQLPVKGGLTQPTKKRPYKVTKRIDPLKINDRFSWKKEKVAKKDTQYILCFLLISWFMGIIDIL